MQRYVARIIRAVIVALFGFGGGVALMVFIACIIFSHDPHPFITAIKAGVGLGLVFGIFLVGVLLPLDLTHHLFLGKGQYREIWELEQTREIIFEGTLKDLTNLCRQALLAVPYVKSVSEDLEHLLIHANIGPSWKSGGEVMDVEINPESESKWKLSCTSKPTSTNIVFDYGKNFENVETWSSRFLTMLAEQNKAA